MKITIKSPHVKDTHIKHTAGAGIMMGTILEAAHMFYPSGLIILGIAGCIAVYEPIIVKHVAGDLGHDDSE